MNKKILTYIKKYSIKFSIFILAFFLVSINLHRQIPIPQVPDIKGISTSIQETAEESYLEYLIQAKAQATYKKLNLKQKIGQIMFVNIPDATLNKETKKFINDYQIGGVVLMQANIKSQKQLKKFTNDLQEISDIPIFIAVDQEGGVVARIPWDEARFISQPHIGLVNREDFAYETGIEHAQTLKQSGINTNLAPVLDIGYNSSPMNSRAFGASSKKVSKLGTEIIKAHKQERIFTTAKHFPGIGRTQTDTHDDIARIDISKETLNNEELAPFKEAIKQKVEFIMVGHALYPQIDSSNPATVSKTITTEILKKQLKFDGIIITDDLNMGALKTFPNKEKRALQAGSDMIMIIDNQRQHQAVIDELSNEKEIEKLIKPKVLRVLEFKFRNIS